MAQHCQEPDSRNLFHLLSYQLKMHQELTPYGKITTSVLIFQDIAVIPMMLIARMLAPDSESSIKDIFLPCGIHFLY